MKFDIEAIIGTNDISKKKLAEEKIEQHKREAEIAWLQRPMVKIVTIVDICLLISATALWFISAEWNAIAIICVLAITIVLSIVGIYKRSNFIQSYVKQKLVEEFGEDDKK